MEQIIFDFSVILQSNVLHRYYVNGKCFSRNLNMEWALNQIYLFLDLCPMLRWRYFRHYFDSNVFLWSFAHKSHKMVWQQILNVVSCFWKALKNLSKIRVDVWSHFYVFWNPIHSVLNMCSLLAESEGKIINIWIQKMLNKKVTMNTRVWMPCLRLHFSDKRNVIIESAMLSVSLTNC